jgi:hypothetical protein
MAPYRCRASSQLALLPSAPLFRSRDDESLAGPSIGMSAARPASSSIAPPRTPSGPECLDSRSKTRERTSVGILRGFDSRRLKASYSSAAAPSASSVTEWPPSLGGRFAKSSLSSRGASSALLSPLESATGGGSSGQRRRDASRFPMRAPSSCTCYRGTSRSPRMDCSTDCGRNGGLCSCSSRTCRRQLLRCGDWPRHLMQCRQLQPPLQGMPEGSAVAASTHPVPIRQVCLGLGEKCAGVSRDGGQFGADRDHVAYYQQCRGNKAFDERLDLIQRPGYRLPIDPRSVRNNS